MFNSCWSKITQSWIDDGSQSILDRPDEPSTRPDQPADGQDELVAAVAKDDTPVDAANVDEVQVERSQVMPDEKGEAGLR